MTTVAARYEVLSSFLARVCERLNVPRPPRGHWAKLRVGKGTALPSLPVAQLGDELEWVRNGRALPAKPRPLLQPTPVAPSTPRPPAARPARHPLLSGAREYFDAARVTESGYLKPIKQLVLDLFVSKDALARGLDLARELYLELEQRGHRVVLAPRDQELHRPDLDVREHPKGEIGVWDHVRWSPGRPTVVFVGAVAIGLTLYELSEETELWYADGKYVRKPPSAARRGLVGPGSTWSIKRQMPTGRFALRAYCPYPQATWAQVWREEQPRQLPGMFAAIAQDLERATTAIVKLVEEGERRAEEERLRWETERRERERQAAEQRRAEALKASREHLLALVGSWDLARRIPICQRDVRPPVPRE
jgi:hypothetical protein